MHDRVSKYMVSIMRKGSTTASGKKRKAEGKDASIADNKRTKLLKETRIFVQCKDGYLESENTRTPCWRHLGQSMSKHIDWHSIYGLDTGRTMTRALKSCSIWKIWSTMKKKMKKRRMKKMMARMMRSRKFAVARVRVLAFYRENVESGTVETSVLD